MRAVYVPLFEPARRALIALSEREFRDPRDQAALLITDGLRRAGVLAVPEPLGQPAAGDPARREPEGAAS